MCVCAMCNTHVACMPKTQAAIRPNASAPIHLQPCARFPNASVKPSVPRVSPKPELRGQKWSSIVWRGPPISADFAADVADTAAMCGPGPGSLSNASSCSEPAFLPASPSKARLRTARSNPRPWPYWPCGRAPNGSALRLKPLLYCMQ